MTYISGGYRYRGTQEHVQDCRGTACHRGTLTTNMNSLERKGYLTRNRSTRDKRVVLVTLTEKGRKAFSITEISTGK